MSVASNKVFEFPQWAIPENQQATLLNTAIVLAAATLIYVAWLAWRKREFDPIAIFVGGGAAVIYEPLGDILTKVAYPPLAQTSLMTSFGRPTPLWMLPNYFFFITIPTLMLLRFLVREGVSARKWWLTYGGLVLFVALFEQPGINAGSWRYYAANQAISINTYPLWVGFVNAQSLFAIATGIFFLKRSVIPASMWMLLAPLVPMLFVGSHVAASLPVSWALYTTNDTLLVNMAALLSIALCFLNVWIGWNLTRRASRGPSEPPAVA